MRLVNFAKLTPEERDAAWAKMDKNRRNALVGEALGKNVVADSWPCFSGDAWEIVKWLREKQHYCYLDFVLDWLEEQAIASSGGSIFHMPLPEWWFMLADWPEVLGRAVVEAVITKKKEESNA